MITNANPGNDTSARTPRRLRRWLLSTVLAVGAVGGLATAVPATASAASAVNYGETPQYHCGTGEVVLDNIRIPNAELPVSWEAVVYYYGTDGAWHPYAQMYTNGRSAWETISSPIDNVYYQQKMYASVPHGYYYAVRVYMVPNANAGYQPHWDWASLSLGHGSGTACVA